jgi:hypothetical protein
MRSVWLRVTILYLAAAIVLTWPLAIHFTTHLGATEGPGDPYLNLWILGWDLRAWTMHPLEVFTGRVFNANIFFPAQGALTFSDHLLLQSLVVSPVYALTHNLVLCYNLLVIASVAASGVAMFLLVRSVTANAGAATIAGLAWMCWPYRTGHLIHLQLQSLYFLPLALWALHRVAAARRWRDVGWLAVFAALQAISSVYYGVMTAIAIGVGAIAMSWASGQWRGRRFWTAMIAAALLGGAIVGPVVVPYWQSQQREGFGRNAFEANLHSANLQSYTQVSPDNLVYGRTGLLAPRQPAPGERDRRDVENQLFPGLVLIGLAAFGLWKGWASDSRTAVVSSAALVAAGIVLSLGPEGVSSVYAAVSDLVFGFQAVRAPARFAVIAVCGLSVLAGIGITRAGFRSSSLVFIGGLMFLEYANAPLTLAAAPATSTDTGRWLAASTTPGAVLYLPLTIDRDNTPFMVESLEHGRPIINGYSGQRPAFYTSFVDEFAHPASMEARTLLKEVDVRYVVSPAPLDGAGTPSSPFVERARLGDRVIYEVVWTEASEGALVDLNAPAPPAPGPPPFAVGESAVYEVQWLSGPLDLPAGTITLRVDTARATDLPSAVEEKPAFVFEASAVTASWVSRFFEASDVFRTAADAELRPLLHLRSLHEGRRQLERAYLFDRVKQRVRIGEDLDQAESGQALVLPLANGARDAVTALWYVRSVPLTPGMSLSVPLSEAGRGMSLDITVVSEESIETMRGRVRALRVDPKVTARVERRKPISMKVWLSTDRSRIPLAAEIDASFGQLRLKLVDYRP